MGYGIAVFPPGHYSPGEDVYIATHNLIKAHAKAYRVYESGHKNKGGKNPVYVELTYKGHKKKNQIVCKMYVIIYYLK
jgi:beta-glucosidase/6-phospho-beta-glucosidase/beta-galactosidase